MPAEVSSADVELATFTPTVTTVPTENTNAIANQHPYPDTASDRHAHPAQQKRQQPLPRPKKRTVKPAATATPGKVTVVITEAELNNMAQMLCRSKVM